MHKHGRGPKDVLVKRYNRWRRGKRHEVPQSRRSNRIVLSLRASKDQLTFGFD